MKVKLSLQDIWGDILSTISGAVEKFWMRLRRFKHCFKGISIITLFAAVFIALFLGYTGNQYDIFLDLKSLKIFLLPIFIILILMNYHIIKEHAKRKHVCSSCLKNSSIATLLIILFLFYFGITFILFYFLFDRLIQVFFPSIFLGQVSILTFFAEPIFETASEEKIDYSELHDNMGFFMNRRAKIIERNEMRLADADDIYDFLKKSLEILKVQMSKEKIQEEIDKVCNLKKLLKTAKSYSKTRIDQKNVDELKKAINFEIWPKIINTGSISLYSIIEVFKDEKIDFNNSSPNIDILTIFVLEKDACPSEDFYRWAPESFNRTLGEINDETCARALEESLVKPRIYCFSDIGLSNFENMMDELKKRSELPQISQKIKNLVLIDSSISKIDEIPKKILKVLKKNSYMYFIGEKNYLPESFKKIDIISNGFEFSILLYILYRIANIPPMFYGDIEDQIRWEYGNWLKRKKEI